MNFVTQKAFSAPISNMTKLILTLLLLFTPVLAQCFLVTASQGGNRLVKLFFCEIEGCVANVTDVFCNEELLFSQTHIASCTGSPPPNTMCQQDGRAFVSIDTDGNCEFEGKDGYIKTAKCKDHSDTCTFISATVEDHERHRYIDGVCVLLLLLCIVGLLLNFCKKREEKKNRGQQVASD